MEWKIPAPPMKACLNCAKLTSLRSYRATYRAGAFAATWTGQQQHWNHLRLTTPMLLNLGLSGFGMAGLMSVVRRNPPTGFAD